MRVVGGSPLYDAIGRTYATTRRADPRIARLVDEALGDAISVVNVGAGTGSYEPENRRLVAIEPSGVMIAQRPAGAAPAIQASAEAIPLPDASVDAAMAILSDHHYSDRARGLRELRRVARKRVVVLQWDRAHARRFWLTRDYLAGFRRLPGMAIDEIAAHLGGAAIHPVPIPWDCSDGFYHAFWRRPEAYLDPAVRAGISVFARLPVGEVESAMSRLAADLQSGAWATRNADLLSLEALDLGYRLLIAEIGARRAT
jgi:SAM-dependent methyltransferase